MDNLSNKKHTKKNITKEWLLSNGFRYNRLLSGEEVDVYTYRFPVLRHDKFTVLECELRVELDKNKIKIDVYDYNSNNKYAPFYYCEYGNYDNLLKEIHKKIEIKLNDLGIRRRENG